MPKIGGFRSFNTARRPIAGFEAMLWLRKGFGFAGGWTVNDQGDLLAHVFGVELGAAWQKTSEQGCDYLSVNLDDPSFPAPIYATLAEVEGEDGL